MWGMFDIQDNQAGFVSKSSFSQQKVLFQSAFHFRGKRQRSQPLAFPSAITVGSAPAKKTGSFLWLSKTNHSDTGRNMSLFSHWVYNRNANADRIGSRVPTWLDRQLTFLFLRELYSDSSVCREPL